MGFFLRFFERRNLYRFLIKKKVKRKNEVTRKLWACVVKKFHGFETVRKDLERKESFDYEPVDIFYDPGFELDVAVLCYFCPHIHLAYKSYIGMFKKSVEKVFHKTVRQCHYCNNNFAKTEENMKKAYFCMFC